MGIGADSRGEAPVAAWATLALAVAIPLGLVALASALGWVSDQVVVIGPFDRASFGWVVVVSLWLSAPVVAGFVWRRLPPATSLAPALVLWVIVAGVATILLWLAVAFPDCPGGANRMPIEWVTPSLVVGVLVGAAVGVSGLIAERIVRGGHPWWAVIIGAGNAAVMLLAALMIAAMTVLAVPACQRSV
jgi:hypothetical protein